jgi:prevent-host-death family protein
MRWAKGIGKDMETVPIRTAEATLSRLLARVEAGEEIVLVRDDKPVAKLVPFTSPVSKRKPGVLKGKISIGPEFFESLPDDELDAWER